MRKNKRSKRRRNIYTPRFRSAKAQLRRSRTRAIKMNLRYDRMRIPPQRSSRGMGVQRDVGGKTSSPLILLGPAQRAACWYSYKRSIGVYLNRNCRLRLLSDSRFFLRFAHGIRWATDPGNWHSRASAPCHFRHSACLFRPLGAAGFGPRPAWGFHPQTPSSLRA